MLSVSWVEKKRFMKGTSSRKGEEGWRCVLRGSSKG
jgi:hypothetical protein